MDVELMTKKCLLILGLIFTSMSQYTFSQKFKKDFKSIKVGVAPIFVGEMAGFYEKSFSKKTTFELGAGILTDNYIKNFLEEVLAVQARKVVPGPSLSAGIRYYPRNLGRDFYFITELKYRLYLKKFSQVGSPSTTEYDQRIIPRFGVGYHIYFDEKFFLDMSANVGFSLNKSYEIGDLYPGKYVKLHFGIGLKFSYQLKKD